MIKSIRQLSEGEDTFLSGGEFRFSNFFSIKRPTISMPERGWTPQTDMFETEDEMVVIVDIAGILENDISVVLNKDILAIRGIRREDRRFKKRHYHHMEIEFGPFERILKLPSYVDQENTTAVYRSGFLEIKMKKSDSPKIRTEIRIK